MSRRWRSSRFASGDDDPLGPLANMVDVVLVFACGLIAALVAQTDLLRNSRLPSNAGGSFQSYLTALKVTAGKGLRALAKFTVIRPPAS